MISINAQARPSTPTTTGAAPAPASKPSAHNPDSDSLIIGLTGAYAGLVVVGGAIGAGVAALFGLPWGEGAAIGSQGLPAGLIALGGTMALVQAAKKR
jgi:hypothetical protein